MNINYKKIIAYLNEPAIVITPNNRLAKSILDDYLIFSRQKIIPKPQCFSYSVFIEKLYKNLSWHAINPQLLTTKQSMYLWQQLIKNHNADINQSVIDASFKSWSHCQLFNLDTTHHLFQLTPQTMQFQQWSQDFLHILTKFNSVTPEQIIPYLINNLQEYPQKIVWFCFDDYTPQQRQLQQFFAAQGTINIDLDLPTNNNYLNNSHLCVADNNNIELSQLMQWLQLQLDNNVQKIGIVIPTLQTDIDKIKRFLQQHLSANSMNISLGQPLTEYTLIAHALCWLEINSSQEKILSHHHATLLLSSPFIAHADIEMLERVQFLQDSELLQEHNINYNIFIQHLQIKTPRLAAVLAQILTYPQSATISEWINLFQIRLKTMEFPGDSSLNSLNYQCYQRFILLFDEMRQLQRFNMQLVISASQAINIITKLAQDTIFQAETATAPTIQIMGLLEAAGCQFDTLWVQGMIADCLPKKIKFSAFIPLELQKKYNLPYTNIQKEAEFTIKTILRLQHSSNTVIFSYATHGNDKQNLPIALLPQMSLYSQQLIPNKNHALISYFDHYKLTSATKIINGNINLLSHQAQCPFKAFASHRLHLHSMPKNQIYDGINAIERGKILHMILAAIWQKLQNQENLLSVDTTVLHELVNNVINITLNPYKISRQYSFPPLIQKIEIQRLQTLIHILLNWEKTRENFKIIALETSYKIILESIDFNIRIDRLDLINNCNQLLIDYKSQLPKTTPWYADRPVEPQLLLYSLINEQINAITFIAIKNNQLYFKGISAEAYKAPKLTLTKEPWQQLQQQWKTNLTLLAQEFVQGIVTPQPYDLKICQTCNFVNLCRQPLITL